MSRVTLKDVAARAGVSYQTVSKVLNNQANFAEETEAKVWAAVDELNFRPNISARNLRTQASNLIGYALRPNLENALFHPILDQFLVSITFTAERFGYHMLNFAVSNESYYGSERYNSLYRRNQVAGFILANTKQDDERIRFLIDKRIPFASFGRSNREWDFCWVDVDGEAGIAQTTDYLIQLGHQRIGLVTWPEGSQTGAIREQGFLRQMAHHGLGINPTWLYRGENNPRSGADAATRFMELPAASRPTAIVCVSDMLAIGVMQALAVAGVQVGKEIAVTGFDDIPMVEYLQPALTTVRQPIAEIGEAIFAMLLKQIRQESVEQRHLLLKPQLVVRESAGSPA